MTDHQYKRTLEHMRKRPERHHLNERVYRDIKANMENFKNDDGGYAMEEVMEQMK